MSKRDDLINHIQELAAAEKEARAANLGVAMPDDPTKTGSDRKFISLEQEHEVRDWARSLGCSEDRLRQAVHAVGHSADKVRDYLRHL
jgi:hypothetical protein